MSESGVVPREAGLRLRDSNLGTMARQLEQDKIEAARLAKQQLEQERRDRKTAEEKEKRRAANEAKAAQAFREYHDLKPSQSRGHVVVRYIEARGGVVNADNYQKGLDDLNDPAFLKLYCPEKATRMENFAIAKAWAADVKPIYVAKCKFCRICFGTEEELSTALGDHSAMSEMSERL